jgi:hypothetical protein
MRCLKTGFDLIKFQCLVLLDTWEGLEVRMELQPHVQVLVSICPVVLVRATHSESEQAFQVIRVCLMSLPKSDDCKVILIILLVKLAEHSPSLRIGFVLLDLCFKAKDCVLSLIFFDEHLGVGNPI